MNFTQYKFPNGARVPQVIDLPAEVEKQAAELENCGWAFEIEVFPDTQIVNMDCCDADRQLANLCVANGPEVPGKVMELVAMAHERWVEQGKPKAHR